MAAQTSTGRHAAQLYTEEKAVHLIRVFAAVVSSMLLVGWMQLIVLNPLKEEHAEMSHMDPSEIIIEPFSLQKLTIFSTFPIVIVMIFWLVKEPQKMTGKLLSLTKLTLVTYALFGFCGGYIVTHYQHSLTAAIYVATLASTTWTSQQPSSNILDELPFADLSNLLATSRLYGMVLICIPFQVLQVLDAGAQVQRWPLPIVLGCTYGYVVGSLVGVTLLYFQNESANKRKSKQGRSQ